MINNIIIFVDTSAWFASIVPSDSDHLIAQKWLQKNNQILLTTDYIIDETLTLLKVRNEPTRANFLGEAFFSGQLATIYYSTEEDVKTTWQVFRQFSDKGWSFTDCGSKVIMDKLEIKQAFTFDHHFRQFGSILIVP